MELTTTPDYQNLLVQISQTYTQGRILAVQAVNDHITETYWQVGRHIVEFEQNGKIRADYATYQMNSQLFVQKYQLYLPDREQLRHEMELSLREVENG